MIKKLLFQLDDHVYTYGRVPPMGHGKRVKGLGVFAQGFSPKPLTLFAKTLGRVTEEMQKRHKKEME